MGVVITSGSRSVIWRNHRLRNLIGSLRRVVEILIWVIWCRSTKICLLLVVWVVIRSHHGRIISELLLLLHLHVLLIIRRLLPDRSWSRNYFDWGLGSWNSSWSQDLLMLWLWWRLVMMELLLNVILWLLLNSLSLNGLLGWRLILLLLWRRLITLLIYWPVLLWLLMLQLIRRIVSNLRIIGNEDSLLFHLLFLLNVSMVWHIGYNLVGIHNSHRFRIVGNLSDFSFWLFKLFMILDLTLKTSIFSKSPSLRSIGNDGWLDLRIVPEFQCKTTMTRLANDVTRMTNPLNTYTEQ